MFPPRRRSTTPRAASSPRLRRSSVCCRRRQARRCRRSPAPLCRWRAASRPAALPRLLVVVGVDLNVFLPFVWQLVLREAGVHRAGLDAGVAIDALLGVDIEHVDLVVVRLVRGRMDAVDGTNLHAGVVLGVDAGFGDDVGHGLLNSCPQAPGREGRELYHRPYACRCTQLRASRSNPGAADGEEVMESISTWLCPTEQHRVRAREAGARVRTARTVAATACGLALFAIVPFQGWWILVLLAVAAVTLGTLEARLRRSEHPELVAVQGMLVILGIVGVGVAFSGGEDSPALPWLILPVAIAAARFRPHVLVVGAAVTAAAMLGISVGVDAQAVVDDPSRLISALTLLVGITAVTSALTEGELEHRDRAVLDPLTGLLNRSSLESRAVEIEEQARLTGGPVSLVLLDLDRFKHVNDTHGHERGDAVLRDVAYEIRGEEFLVLLPGVALHDAVDVAERVRRAVTESRPGELDVTISAGVAAGAGEEIRYERLFRAADHALLEAKRAGRDRVEVAGDRSAVRT